MLKIPSGLSATRHAEVLSVSWYQLATYLLTAYGSPVRADTLLESPNDTAYWIPKSSYRNPSNAAELQAFLKAGSIECWKLRGLVYQAILDGHLPDVAFVVQESW